MKKQKMMGTSTMTFREGCEAYLLNCRQRNLREATIKHYRQSYTQFYKRIDPEMPLEQFDVKVYDGYVRFLLDKLDNDVSVNSYLRDLITTLHFLMDEGHLRRFKMKAIRVDKQAVDTYTDDELQILLRKPDTRNCRYVEYQCWVMTTMLFSTGIRQRSLMHLTIRDADLDNQMLHVRVTKNRKPLLVPLNTTLCSILREYLVHREAKSDDELLFTNVYGQPLQRSTCYGIEDTCNQGFAIAELAQVWQYLHERGVEHPAWLAAAKGAADFLIDHYMPEHGFGKAWNVETGECADPEGTIGAYVIPGLVSLYHVSKDEKYLTAARTALRFYRDRDLGIFRCTAGALDTYCIDKESSGPLLAGALALYDIDGSDEWLDCAKKAGWYFCSWMFHHDTLNRPAAISPTTVTVRWAGRRFPHSIITSIPGVRWWCPRCSACGK